MTVDQSAAVQTPASIGRLPRVALICDLVEENWPSMDLVADMLFEHLEQHYSTEISAARLCPSMQIHFSHAPGLKNRQASYNLDRVLNRFVDYPRWLRVRRSDFDLFHIIDHSYSQLVSHLPPERTVVTCHDLDTFRCLLEPQREKRPRWFRAMTRKILDGFQRAAHVIAISASTRNELLRHQLFAPQQISVVHLATHPLCSPLPNAAADADAERLLSGFNGSPTLLNVGSTIQRKRMDVLLRVFASVRRAFREARLIRVGGALTAAQQQLARQLEVEDAILTLPHLTRPTLAAVYRRADLLLHTAEAEGFGLPVIEAMACGCPVVASDIPVLREVGGSTATYCPVGDIDAWHNTITQLLRERTQECHSWDVRRRQGIAHVSRFSWIETARATAAIYKAVLQ